MTTPAGAPHGRALDRVADALTQGGHRFTRRGTHIQASCPLHTDNQPSLSIDQGDRGTSPGVLMKCHSQDCTEHDLAEALGLRYDELWDEPLPMCPVCSKPTKQDPATGEWVHPYCAAKRGGRPIPRDHIAQRSTTVKSRRKIGRLPTRLIKPSETVVEPEKQVAEYDHITHDGEVVARSVRKEKWVRVEGSEEPEKRKRFYQRFADGSGGWLKSKKDLPAGTIIPIYRLPEVQLSILAGQPVHLVEGHKDADAIVAAGGAATTNIDGAKNLHREDTDQLAGADVITVVDRDLAGYLRGLASLELLDGVANSNTVVLPATTERKSDAFDHLQAGHGLDDFIEVSKDELQRLVILERADAILRDVQGMPAEILAREERAETAASSEERLEEHKAADRWSIEIGEVQLQGKLLPLRDELIKVPGCTRAEVRAMDEIIAQVRQLAVEAYGRRQLVPDHDLAELLGLVDHDDSDETGPTPDNIVDFPKAEYRPDSPAHRIPMATSTEFAYSLGDDGFERGVWMATKNTPWTKLADLPYVHRRVIRRDGRGKKTGMHYLLSAGPDDKPAQFDLAALKDGSWANHLGVGLSQDLKVIAAVATAIIFAAEEVPAQEATPDIDRETGKIIIPAAIDQYFECAPVEREEALDSWREIVAEMTLAPKLALVLGASAIAPFVHELGKSHTVSMTGGPMQGKSIALRVAAGLWGDSVHGNGSLYSSWNATGQGLPRLLGTLRVLPAFRDETGLAGQSPDYWAKLAYQVSEGIDRLRYDRMTDYSMDKPWWGILFSTGNEQFADGCNSGRFQGVPRRIIDLSGPFTVDAAHGDRIFRVDAPAGSRGLLERCYGHLGTQIAETVDAAHAIELIKRVDELLDCPPEAVAIEHLLHMHVAGAMIIDEILGTGAMLTTAAVAAAQEHLDEWRPPAREAEQVLDVLRDSIAREPASWPTRSEYVEHLLPYTHEGTKVELPQAGVNRTLIGIRADDDSWVAVFPSAWRELFPSESINSGLALRQLAEEGILDVQRSRRNGSSWVVWVKFHSGKEDPRYEGRPKGANMYRLRLPNADDAHDEQPAPGTSDLPQQPELETEPPVRSDDHGADRVAGSDAEVAGPVAPPVAGSNMALTREVARVAGSQPNTSRSVRAREPEQSAATTVLVHAEGLVELDPSRAPGDWTDRSGTVRRRSWARTAGPCEVCGQPCTIVVDGHRVHLLCWELRYAGDAAQPQTKAPGGRDNADAMPRAASTQAAPGAERPRNQGGRLQHGLKDARWAAPAAVLAGDQAYVSGQAPAPWTAQHLGELAMLVRPDQLRLGYGGDRDRLPDPGQIWLTGEALERLGLPTRLDWPDGRSLDESDNAEERLFDPIQIHPAVVEAKKAGWEISTAGGNVRTWTRLRHPDLLPGGAYLVFEPWHPKPIEGLTDDPQLSPADLADRLATLADALGGPFLITPAITGVKLVERTRPTRHDPDTAIDGNSRRRKALLADRPELPPFLQDRSDARFSGLETDFTWWRLWEPAQGSDHAALTEEERGRAWVHGYDRKGSYLGVWERLELGLEGLRHREGEDAAWPGNEKPGFFLVDEWQWPEWGLPDPAGAARARVEDGHGGHLRWVTSHTLRQLKAHDIEPAVHESWTWDVTGSYLEQAAKIIKGALSRSSQNPAEGWMRPIIKQVYTRTGGKFAAHRTNSANHLHRPDWWYHIVAASRTAILYQLTKAFERSGELPVAVDHDAVFFVSDEPDPAKAWPGDPKKLADVRMGDWRPIGSARLEEWGPKHLVDNVGFTGAAKPAGKSGKGKPRQKGRFDFRRWNYTQAVSDLIRPGDGKA
jgi:hypothetical protein